jgi:hypothetical protein
MINNTTINQDYNKYKGSGNDDDVMMMVGGGGGSGIK